MAQARHKPRNKFAMENAYAFPKIYRIPVTKIRNTRKFIANMKVYCNYKNSNASNDTIFSINTKLRVNLFSKSGQSHLMKEYFTETRLI
jgi:hypothetical protein